MNNHTLAIVCLIIVVFLGVSSLLVTPFRRKLNDSADPTKEADPPKEDEVRFRMRLFSNPEPARQDGDVQMVAWLRETFLEFLHQATCTDPASREDAERYAQALGALCFDTSKSVIWVRSWQDAQNLAWELQSNLVKSLCEKAQSEVSGWRPAAAEDLTKRRLLDPIEYALKSQVLDNLSAYTTDLLWTRAMDEVRQAIEILGPQKKPWIDHLTKKLPRWYMLPMCGSMCDPVRDCSSLFQYQLLADSEVGMSSTTVEVMEHHLGLFRSAFGLIILPHHLILLDRPKSFNLNDEGEVTDVIWRDGRD